MHFTVFFTLDWGHFILKCCIAESNRLWKESLFVSFVKDLNN